jgi:CheY-like chemotaxis protein
VSGADTDASRGRRSQHDTTPDEQPRAGESGQAPLHEPRLILIAEDEEPIAEALSIILEDAGYVPLVASDGARALELARAQRPALVITDLMMPHLDGSALIAALREDAQLNGHAPVPIILMTAAGMKKAEEAGADVVVRKPFNVADLEAIIRRLLGE